MLVYGESRKPEYPVENQQTQPTYDAESGNRALATLVEGERSHHCAIPTSNSSLRVKWLEGQALSLRKINFKQDIVFNFI